MTTPMTDKERMMKEFSDNLHRLLANAHVPDFAMDIQPVINSIASTLYDHAYSLGGEEVKVEMLENIIKDFDKTISDFELKAQFAISEMKRYRECYSEDLNLLTPTQKDPSCTDPNLKTHCSGCTDKNSEGTHQGCTIEHGHVGCDKYQKDHEQ